MKKRKQGLKCEISDRVILATKNEFPFTHYLVSAHKVTHLLSNSYSYLLGDQHTKLLIIVNKHHSMKRTREEADARMSSHCESSALKTILGNSDSSIDDFFKSVYQENPKLYRAQTIHGSNFCPILKNVLLMGFDGIANMLEESRCFLGEDLEENINTPLFFQNQTILHPPEIHSLYHNSPFAAYLDSCSIVNNHADLLSPPLAALSLNLQHSFPHVYINTYLTPPKAAAVMAHADDRDVFVIQIEGKKNWKVYDSPILFPYTNEQVGKNGLPVPKEILEAEPLIDVILHPGDVLYMPRGYVHEAETGTDAPSFHATVAIATHDWSLSRTISSMVAKELDSNVRFRKAVPPNVGTSNHVCEQDRKMLEDMVANAKSIIEKCINVETISAQLREKYDRHNNMMKEKRLSLSSKDTTLHEVPLIDGCITTGPYAARFIRLASVVRASTTKERASVPPPMSGQPPGLRVRDDSWDALMTILNWVKTYTFEDCRVSDLRKIWKESNFQGDVSNICDFTLLSFVKTCVSLGAIAMALP